MTEQVRWLNVGCGTHRAPAPWVNLDIHDDGDTTQPDILVTTATPYPFNSCSVERIFLGHVLEHIPWGDLPWFLSETWRVLAPGGTVVACGPDVHKALTAWKADLIGIELMHSVLEHAAYPGSTDWPGALHQWNCTEARMLTAFCSAGMPATPLDRPPEDWPAVGYEPIWQSCIHAWKAPT